MPQGWRATPATQPVTFTREDESATVRFALQPPAATVLASAAMKPGGNQFKVNAVVKSGTGTFTQGYQVVEYPHTTRRHVLTAPQVAVKALDVNVKPNLSLGYVMGVGDEVPAALIQLGVKLTLIDPEELAWGDLSRYDVIMTGVRAYERRVDLRANNQRLLDYAKAGGTVIVQYNKFEFNDAQYGPFAAKVGRERVTDENAEMKLLQPQHPVFNTPNAIGRADWAGWVQERGLYFLDEANRDPQYTDLIEFTEPFAVQQGREARCAGRSQGRPGPLALRRDRPVAPVAGGYRWCIPPHGEPDQLALAFTGGQEIRREFSFTCLLAPVKPSGTSRVLTLRFLSSPIWPARSRFCDRNGFFDAANVQNRWLRSRPIGIR